MLLVNALPADARIRCYGSNPLDLTLTIKVNGQPADVVGWVWRAEVLIEGRGGLALVPFETFGIDNGVRLLLPGESTERIAATGPRGSRFLVYGRNPAASAGYTVLRGFLVAEAPAVPTPIVGPPMEVAV